MWKTVVSNLNWNNDHSIELNKIKNFLGDLKMCSSEKLEIVKKYLISDLFVSKKVFSTDISRFRGKVLAQIKTNEIKLNNSVAGMASYETPAGMRDKGKKRKNKNQNGSFVLGPIYPNGGNF